MIICDVFEYSVHYLGISAFVLVHPYEKKHFLGKKISIVTANATSIRISLTFTMKALLPV